jgi:three-Cys-motif partner protein
VWAGRVLYVDTHAGRGRYESGDPGSPVIALQTLLRHSYRDKLLNASEFNFLFIERDPANLAALEGELSLVRPLPARVNVETSQDDAFEKLSAILDDLRRDRARMAPAFLFVDPYGFKIPAHLLSDLMKAGRVELFINVMWRELDMLVQQRPDPSTPHARTLDEIFGSDDWRTKVTGTGMDERLGRAIPVMARGIGAKWWTSAVRMVTGGQATRYVLLHLTNSDDGRDLMKECAWSVSPAGEFLVRRSDNPDQQFLIKPEPDLRSLRDWIIGRLSRRPERWQDLHGAVRPEWWLPKHVNEVVRGLKKEGVITADAVPGRKFGAAANPVLRLVRSKPGAPRA